MEFSFSKHDARKLIRIFRKEYEKVSNLNIIKESHERQIKDHSRKVIEELYFYELSNRPIEDLFKNKQGTKINSLKERGYDTISKIMNASINDLSSIRGIGYDTASSIKDAVNTYIDAVKKNTRIKLSLDNKTVKTTYLILNIDQYRLIKPYLSQAIGIIEDYEKYNQLISDLEPITKFIVNPFLSQEKKEKAKNAYFELGIILENGLTERIKQIQLGLKANKVKDFAIAWNDFALNPVEFHKILEEIVPEYMGDVNSQYGLPEDLAKEIEEQCFFPDGLLCDLRRYQEWGVKYILHQGKALLGDEMGLGKTIQSIATMVSLKNTGASHFMVVCPASVLENWCREITSKSRLNAIKIHGSRRKFAFEEWKKRGGVAVTTYETTSHILDYGCIDFSLLIVDEAHYIKNESANRSRNVISISHRAERILFLTGTPIENKVEEMVKLISYLNPPVASSVESLTFMANAPEFRKKVIPVYYRRKREDVLTELPDKEEMNEWCSMNSEEEHIYENLILSKNAMAARRLSWNVNDINNSCKAQRLKEIVEEAEREGRKVIVFSFFLDTIEKVKELLGDKCTQSINGSVPVSRRQEIIDEFDKSKPGTVLPAQIQSAGTGLNIQSASVVVICEPQYKPSTENQAIARAYRMGQTRKVLVYRLLCSNTIDERITDLLAEKQAQFDAFADKSEAAQESLRLDDKSINKLIEEEINRINKKNNNA